LFWFRDGSCGPQLLNRFQAKTVQRGGTSFGAMPHSAGFELIAQLQKLHSSKFDALLVGGDFQFVNQVFQGSTIFPSRVRALGSNQISNHYRILAGVRQTVTQLTIIDLQPRSERVD
jgi:hypothetical protein